MNAGTGNMRKFGLIPFALACTLSAASAANYPDHPIHFIVPQAAGSATDTVARILAAELTKELGQSVIVDDRPGGALTVGLDIVAKSPPDGYTIGMGPIGALAITRHMVAKLPYDIERDFQPIALVARGHLLLAVSPTLPINSVQELVDYAKKNPGKLSNASSSSGSPGHVGGELFKFMTGTQIVHIPYRGGPPAITDLMAGRVDIMFESLQSIAPIARSASVAPSVRRRFRTCLLSAKPCLAIWRRLGPASSHQPGCRGQSSTGSMPPSTRCSQPTPSSRNLRLSATNPPAARRRTSRKLSRPIPPNGRT